MEPVSLSQVMCVVEELYLVEFEPNLEHNS